LLTTKALFNEQHSSQLDRHARTINVYRRPDLRGRMYRERRLMPPAETTEFLRRQKVANVDTVDANGWPYVVPLVYIYEGGDLLYLHTGDH